MSVQSLAPRDAAGGLTPEQVDLIKRTICKGATDDELTLFVSQANRMGLDPFSRQIHGVKRWDAKQQREVLSIQVGIDGFRLISERTGEANGTDGPQWCGEDGVWRDVWLDQKPPSAARVTVFRKGRDRGYTCVAHWAEYAQRAKDGKLIGMWPKMPALMLAKCAEALALRRAFPAELSGVYEPSEIPTVEAAADDDQPRQHQRPALPVPPTQHAPRQPTPAPAPVADAGPTLLDEVIELVDRTGTEEHLLTHYQVESITHLDDDTLATLKPWLLKKLEKLNRPQHQPNTTNGEVAL